jgi:hypothetical protein
MLPQLCQKEMVSARPAAPAHWVVTRDFSIYEKWFNQTSAIPPHSKNKKVS